MVSISQILKDEANKYRRVLKGKGEDRAAAGAEERAGSRGKARVVFAQRDVL